MKKIIALALLSTGIYGHTFAQQSCDLDAAFGVDGKAYTRIDAGDDGEYIEDMLLQPDGRIISVGWFHTGASGNYSDVALTRHLPDGMPDSTFGVNGVVILNLSHENENAEFIRKAALQADGKILVAGGIDGVAAIEAAIARLLPNGELDSTFGMNGIVTNDFGQANNMEVHGIVVQQDKKIVIGVQDGYLARYDSTGVIDSTFGVNGIIYTGQVIEKLALQDDGKLVVAGTYYIGDPFFGVQRFNSMGGVDSTFGNNGLSYFNFNDLVPASVPDWVTDVRVLPDHRIMIGGGCTKMDTIDYSYDTTMFAVAMLMADGSLDASYGTDGRAVISFGGDFERIHNITLRADGSAYLAGEANSDYFAIARLRNDGTPDSTFSDDGRLLLDYGPSADYAYASLLQADGKLVLGGPSNDGSNYGFGIARLLGDFATGILNLKAGTMEAFIYPNPVHEQETLTYTLAGEEKISVRLLDAQGRLLKTFINNEVQQKGMHRQALSFPANLAQGNYFISISSGAAQTTLKVVK